MGQTKMEKQTHYGTEGEQFIKQKKRVRGRIIVHKKQKGQQEFFGL